MEVPPPPPPPPAQPGLDQAPPPPPSGQIEAVQQPTVSPYDLLYQRQSAVELPAPSDHTLEHQCHSQHEHNATASQADLHYPPPPDMQPDSDQSAQPSGHHGAAQQPDTQISQEQYANMSEQDQNTYWQQWYEYEQYQQWQQQDQARQWEAYYAAQVQPQHQQAAYNPQYQQPQSQPYQQYQQQQPQQQQQQQWPQQADPYSQYQQYAAPAAQPQQPSQQAYTPGAYQQPAPSYSSAPPESHSFAPPHSGSMVTQAAHALPHAPMGPSAAMQLAAGLHLAPPKKPAVPDWVRQELLKRGMQNDASGVKARGGSDSEGDDVAAKHPRRFTEKGSGSGSRWGADAGILAAKTRQQNLAAGNSEEDSEAEAEEAERQARVSLEIKKSLTHILLSVTDSLFDHMAQEVCQQAVDSAQQKDGGNAANLAAESEYESDSAAAGGADLLGLGYASDGDSQDSASKPKPAKSSPTQPPEPFKAEDNGNSDVKADPERDASLSPSAAAGGWVKQEEEDSKPEVPTHPFVKGQRLWYLEKDGNKAASTLVSVDNSVAPPSYAVRIDKTNSVRETEGHRLQHMLAEKSNTGVTAESPAAVSSLEQIIQSMQQIKAAASVPNPRPAPKGHPVKRPMTLPSAIISAPAATPKQQTPVEHDGQSSDAVPAATSPAKSQPDAEIRSKSHLKPAQQQAAQLPEDSSAPASTAGTTKDVPQQTAQQRGLQTATNTSMLAESDRVEGTAGKEQFDSAAMQPNASKAVGHQANLPASNSQADMSEAKTSLESKPVKDSRAHTDSKDTGGKRSRGKEKVKESSKGKQSRKDKRPSRDERRRSISRSRSRSPKRRKASPSPVPALARSRRRSPSPARRKTKDSRSPTRRRRTPSPANRKRTRDSRSPVRKGRTPSPARRRRHSRSPIRQRRRSRSNDRRRKDSPNPGRRRRSSVQHRSNSPVRR